VSTTYEFQHPAPHRFVGDVEPSLGEEFLDIAVAQREAEIEPDRVLDDLWREAMATVAERSHLDILPDTPLAPDPVSVTTPASRIDGMTVADLAPPARRTRCRATSWPFCICSKYSLFYIDLIGYIVTKKNGEHKKKDLTIEFPGTIHIEIVNAQKR